MKKTIPMAVLVVLLAGAGAWAQDAQEKAPKPQGPVVPLQVQVVFNRYQGEKKVASVHYTLPVNADNSYSRVHMGFQVPLRYESKENSGNVVFKDVGNSVGCRAQPADAGRFKLDCGFDQSSVHSNGDKPAEATLLPPVLRDFRSDVSFFLRDGQSSQITAATDPVSGDVVKVDVTLNVVK
ncbi:MAG TPA: hypothetical protein VMT70_11100 [Vicinamibacteria bacterium]|nr:hypothetical protein [Vicinamibacteria bacterium]